MAFDCICLQCMPMDEAVFISIMIQVDFILENILCAIFSCAASVRLHLGISRHSPCAKSADVVKQVYAKCVCVCIFSRQIVHSDEGIFSFTIPAHSVGGKLNRSNRCSFLCHLINIHPFEKAKQFSGKIQDTLDAGAASLVKLYRIVAHYSSS